MKIHTIKRWDRKITCSRFWAIAALVVAWGGSLFAHSWIISLLLDAAIFIVTAYCIHYFFGIVWSTLSIVLGSVVSVVSYVSHMHIEDILDIPKLLFMLSYITVGIVGVFLIEWMRRMQYKAELIEMVSKSRYDMFLRLDNAYQVGLQMQSGLQKLLQYISEHQHSIVMIKSINHTKERTFDPISLLTIPDPSMTQNNNLVIHNDDLNQIAAEQTTLRSKIRVSEQGKPFRTEECICKKFPTYLGDFFVWHLVN